MNNSNGNNALKKYYEILEIDSDASEEDITRAYRYLKTLYSSDSAATSPIDDEWDEADRQEILNQLEEAYTKLMTPPQIEEEPFELEEADLTTEEQQPEGELLEEADMTTEEQQPEEEPVFIELDKEEIALESIEEKEIHPENLVEIEIPSEILEEEISFESKEEEEIPVEDLEEEEAPAESPEMGDTKPEIFIDEELIEKSIEEPIEEAIEEPIKEPIEEAIEEPIKESIEETIEEPTEESIEEPIEESIDGMTLRKIRKNQGLTIQELADSTRIPKIIVGYIEREEYSKLPDAGYLRWYITALAKALSLDPKDTANQYMKRFRQWKKDQDSQD